jgi:hypothetical protein
MLSSSHLITSSHQLVREITYAHPGELRAILAVLPGSEEKPLSPKEIVLAMGLEVSTHID